MKKHSFAAVSLTLLATGLVAPSVTAAHAADADAGVPSHLLAYTAETNGFGTAMSRTSCDVNGDGLDDVVVGDRNWVRGEHGQVGAAYVLFGSRTATGGDASDPAAAGAVRIDGPAKTVPAGTWAGWSVSCLGDVNGDGNEDFVIGAGSRNHHEVAVMFGAADFGPADLQDLGNRGYKIVDPGAQDNTLLDRSTDNFGYYVGPAGDIDGDGLADVAIGDLLADYTGNNAGRVWIVKGKGTTTTVDVQADTDQVLMTIDGAAAGDRLANVDSVGDTNGDGKDDLLLAAYSAAVWAGGTTHGAAYVVQGGSATQIVAGAAGNAGFEILGPVRGRDRMGMSSARIGDVNGDGLEDFVVGADSALTSGYTGGVAIVHGSTSNAPVMTDPTGTDFSVYTCADGSRDADCTDSTKVARGYWVNGAEVQSQFGFSVAGLPDVNGDDVPDVVVGAYAEATDGVTHGAAYVLHVDGQRSGVLDLAEATSGFERHAATTRGTFGRSVASAGDFDGNGVPDFVTGAQSNNVTVVLRGALATEATLDLPTALVAGAENEVSVDVAALVGSGSAVPTGTVAFSVDGAPVAGLEAVEVRDGVATVALPALTKGQHTLKAVFTPADAAAFAPAEVATDVDVAARTVTGRLVLDTRLAVVGEDVEAAFLTSRDLTGELEFTVDGTRVGAAAVVDGEAVVTLTDLGVGEHEVTVAYAGDDVHAAFEAQRTLRVVKDDATIQAPRVSTTSLVAGSGAVTATVAVPGVTQGRVDLFDNGTRVGTAAVSGGVATFTLKAPQAGTHALTARFAGNDTLRESALSAATSFTVVKARPGTVKVTAKKFAQGTRPKVTVTVGKLTNGKQPVGTVTVKAAGKTYKVALTAAKKGKVTVTLKKASKAVKVRATFTPADQRNVASASSRTVKVAVRR